ncbi:hypothetical protein LEP1GSC052_0164 [Leptospira kmetyi serovar Malaysia str. Bejo-Iso9]|nr:hypothetical protein LEP1GSC052_0164 [Leptospira kmetyi serovar Malaysia str. Bejo-Iso9]
MRFAARRIAATSFFLSDKNSRIREVPARIFYFLLFLLSKHVLEPRRIKFEFFFAF